MKKEEFNSLITQIGSLQNIEEVRTKLLEMQNGVNADYDAFAAANTERDSLREKNESLRQANMNLFLQIGSKPGKTDQNNNVVEKPKTLKYEDLFDKEGGLK